MEDSQHNPNRPETSAQIFDAKLAREHYLTKTEIIRLDFKDTGDDDDNKSSPAIKNLQKYLSIYSVLSNKSAFTLNEEAASERTVRLFENIGEGFCAIIHNWEEKIVKRARNLAGKNEALWNDYCHHMNIHHEVCSGNAIHGVSTISVPTPFYYVRESDVVQWSRHYEYELPMSPFMEPTSLLIAERIPPLPRRIRQDLIRVFCPPNLRRKAVQDRKNRACLVRLYLGVRRLPMQSSQSTDFSLRNFELTLDKMEKIGIDAKQFVVPMADALAVMHLRCHSDASDVEFVLGSSPEPCLGREEMNLLLRGNKTQRITTWRPMLAASTSNVSFLKRSVRMWLLDFNNVRKIQAGAEGVRLCVEAFWQNDPYYPRPASEGLEGELWELFKEAYMDKVKLMICSEEFGMAFLAGVEEEAKRRGTTAAGPPPKGVSSPLVVVGRREKGKKKQRKYVGQG